MDALDDDEILANAHVWTIMVMGAEQESIQMGAMKESEVVRAVVPGPSRTKRRATKKRDSRKGVSRRGR